MIEESGGLQPMGLQQVGYNWATKDTCTHGPVCVAYMWSMCVCIHTKRLETVMSNKPSDSVLGRGTSRPPFTEVCL